MHHLIYVPPNCLYIHSTEYNAFTTVDSFCPNTSTSQYIKRHKIGKVRTIANIKTRKWRKVNPKTSLSLLPTQLHVTFNKIYCSCVRERYSQVDLYRMRSVGKLIEPVRVIYLLLGFKIFHCLYYVSLT